MAKYRRYPIKLTKFQCALLRDYLETVELSKEADYFLDSLELAEDRRGYFRLRNSLEKQISDILKSTD